MPRSSLAAIALVAAVAGAVGLSRSDRGSPATGLPVEQPPYPPLLGVVSKRQPAQLVRVDPDSLRPRPGARVAVGSEGCAPRSGGSACWGVPPWSYSPDRSLLAVARHEAGVVRSVRIVDVARMRVDAEVPILGGGVGLLAWQTPDRVLALQEVCCDERQDLLVIDPTRHRVIARRALAGTVLRAARTPDELVLLLAPAQQIGPVQLAIVDHRGAVRTANVERILAGIQPRDTVRYRVEQPGLAIDPGGRRVFVVGKGLLAELDLASLQVSYHALTRPVSLLGRLRNWFAPDAYAKGASGATRSAVWLGGETLAVVGTDEEETRIRPAGLTLIDTQRWRFRTIDRAATEIHITENLLLATGAATGLAAYGFDGTERFRVQEGHPAWVEQVFEGRAYVGGMRADGRPAPLRVVDLATGRTVARRAAPLPFLLLDPASGPWDG